jgi:hypothetical protein
MMPVMSLLHRLRRRSTRVARISAALFVLVWLAMVATPCAMAMQLGQMPADHDCPHCPPTPCHDLAPEDCNAPEPIETPRVADQTAQFDAAPVAYVAGIGVRTSTARVRSRPPTASPRAGPPAYLLNLRFQE